MEKTFFEHINYLLPIHNYIVIPDLGAFIMNMEDAVISDNGEVFPPKCAITFNSEITHNDGILSSHIISKNGISYNEACNRIRESVRTIKSRLKRGEIIVCGSFGSLEMDAEGHVIFARDKNYIHPNYTGLFHTEIKRIEDINKNLVREKRYISFKYATGGIAATVVAALLFIAPGTNIKNNNSQTMAQKADFLSAITNSVSKKTTDQKEAGTIAMPIVEAATISNIKQNDEIVKIPPRTYYIIVGGEDSRNRAANLLEKFQAGDFPNAAIVETSDRYRIYVASFYDKSKAESFLENFRKENPEYQSAWLFSKRNN